MRAVERISDVGRMWFIDRHIRRNQPVVVTDAVERWNGFRTWTIDYFAEIIGDAPVEVQGDRFGGAGYMGLEEFMVRFEAQESAPPDEIDLLDVPYLRGIRTAAGRIDHRSTRTGWSRPYFLARSGYVWPPQFFVSRPEHKAHPLFGVYISPRGAKTALHVDPRWSSAVLCQIRGTKAGFLFPPETTPLWSKPSIEAPDARAERARRVLVGQAPDYEGLEPVRFDLEPGDTVFIPAQWGHEVFTTSGSISLTYNFRHLVTDNFRYARNPRVWRRGVGRVGHLLSRRWSPSDRSRAANP